ncbi:ATP12 family protein [Pseudoxanthobacter sp.]|uniref:ATP12 family chaperone protein n=1 Tax=Pseudoxanthobacter sp. TaxID=1925742 RepID=UPI002FE06CD0
MSDETLFEKLAAPTGDDDATRMEKNRHAVESAFRSEKPQHPRRFYKTASVAPAGEGFAVRLDDRPVRTPGRNLLALPSQALAEAVAAEWQAQETHIDPATMPLTRLVNAAIDGAGEVAAMRAEMLRYAGTDLLCYRAEDPQGLVDMQNAVWDPVLAWADDALGARFVLAGGIMHVGQPAGALAAIDRALPHGPGLLVAALQSLTTLTGSVLLPLALLHGQTAFDDLWTAAHVDEDWNIRLWGSDREAVERRAFREAEARAAAAVVAALASDAGTAPGR